MFRLPIPLVIYLALLVLPLRFFVGPVQMTGLRLFLLMMAPVLLYRMAAGQAGRLIGPDMVILAFPLWVGVSMAVNSPANAVEQAGMAGIEMTASYFLARCLIRDVNTLRRVIASIVLLLALFLPIALLESVTGRPAWIEMLGSIPGLASVDILSIPQRLGLERVQGPFAHPIHFGLFAASLGSLCWLGMEGAWNIIQRFSALLIITAMTFLSLSSGALLCLLVQLALLAWAGLLTPVKGKWLWLAALLVGAYVAVDLLSNRTPIRVFFSYATFSAHNAYWRGLIFEWGLFNIGQNPLYGLGLRDWVRPHFMYSGSMDNFWLVNAVRHGLPGFGLLALLWVWGVVRVAVRCTGSDPISAQINQAWVICMVALTLALCTVHVWTAIYSYIFFLLGAGRFLAESTTYKTPPIANPTAKRPARLPYTRVSE